MDELQHTETRGVEHDRAAWDHGLAGLLAEGDSAEPGSSRPLRCVSSGYLDHGRSCTLSVPSDVAGGAWRRELERSRERADRFFRFAWRGEVWLAYGLGNGCVRGVYCPSHSAQRDERAFAAVLQAA